MNTTMQIEVMPVNGSSVTQKALAAIVSSRKRVFREDRDTTPRSIGRYQYMPWGADDQMPYDILDLIEEDEVMTTCQQHVIRTCYGGGLHYETRPSDLLPGTGAEAGEKPSSSPLPYPTLPAAEEQLLVRYFLNHNRLNTFFMGVCTDLKCWGWCVTVVILNQSGTRITGVGRREVMYCRLAPADKNGNIPYILCGNFRKSGLSEQDVEVITLLNQDDPLGDLQFRMGIGDRAKAANKNPERGRKFAILTRITTPDTTYYPIPPYASLFKSKWYDIKRLIATAKHAKLKHSAPLKYIIEVENGYWEKRFTAAGLTEVSEQTEEMNRVKKELVDFLTGAENSGRAIFSGYYVDPVSGKEVHDIRITNLETKAEGGDWQTDIQEAINMICFAMGVHSSLVGSVPGNTNNTSGSDKRELYTIAQCMDKPSHDLLLEPHFLICAFNGWHHTLPVCDILQLTTLDKHKDMEVLQSE